MAKTRSQEFATRRRKAKQRTKDNQLQLENLEPKILLASDVAQVAAVVPQPITRDASGQLQQARNQIVVHFNDRDLLDGPVSAENTSLYQLIYTADTITNSDDVRFNPTTVNYDPATDRAVLTFGSNLDQLAGGDGVFRLRINTSESRPRTPLALETEDDPGSSFVTSFDAGTLANTSKIIDGSIDPEDYPLSFPGSIEEPGHRKNDAQPHFSGIDLEGRPIPTEDVTPGISTIFYNFEERYGFDPLGNQLRNLITDTQEQRAREIFDIYGASMGVQFVETATEGLTIATGDLRAFVAYQNAEVPNAPAAYGDTNPDPFVFDPTVILGNSTDWDDHYGGSWFQFAMGEIGRALGLGVTPELPPSSVTGHLGEAAAGQAVIGDQVSFGIVAERIFPGDAAELHGRHMFRPEANDIDLYKFQLRTSGVFSAETIAERLADSSLLDTTLTLFDAAGEIISRNDDYFSEDSLISLNLDSGTYYIGVAASGNRDYDPVDAATGLGGTSEGPYRLRLDFSPATSGTLIDAFGLGLDGDADGEAGGIFNFWFEANDPARTVYVDKSASSSAADGTLGAPYNNIATALTNIGTRDIVRIVGNGGADRNINTLGDNLAYEVGFSNFGALSDGGSLEVPQDVTVMIDAGAIFKMRRSVVHVGSSAVAIDRSGGALQVLGTPTSQVVFTSAENQNIGVDTDPLTTVADPGEWGGIVFQNDVDRSEGRFDYESEGIFLNYVNQADIQYGGGNVTIESVQQIVNPIHMIDVRPTISFNKITFSADSAMSANPDSFEESRFNAIDSFGRDYQAAPAGADPDTWTGFTLDYNRVGPNIHGNTLTDNTTNGLFVRIDTPAGGQLERLSVSGRWDDTDVVHVLAENVIIGSLPGGPRMRNDGTLAARPDAQLVVDPGIIVKSSGARIEVTVSSQLIAEGTEDKPIIFTSLLDDRFGVGGTTVTNSPGIGADRDPRSGDWGGIYAGQSSRLSLDNVVVAYGGGVTRVEGAFAGFNAVEIHQAEAARITNSTFEANADGTRGQSESDRAGRGTNEAATVFVRGAQPIIIGNTFSGTTGTNAAPISIDVNSLNNELLPDYGRSRGSADRSVGFDQNQGALIGENAMGGNTLNGMIVRSGVLTTEGVWDDTDIVHIVLGPIVVPDFHSEGGLRLESSDSASLVVKFQGDDAGIIASGGALENTDRIGGFVNVVGQPGQPVVLTALADDSVGAGNNLAGRAQTNTDEGILGRNDRTRREGTFQIDLNFGPLIRQNPDAMEAAERAARMWEPLFDDNISVTIDVEFDQAQVPDGIAHRAVPQQLNIQYNQIRGAMISDAGSHESIVSRIPSQQNINVTFPDRQENPFTVADTILINTANYKALEFEVPFSLTTASPFDPDEATDGVIWLNPDPVLFSIPENHPTFFDYVRNDGIQVNEVDFTGVIGAAIGNILGFESAIPDVISMLADPTLLRDVSLTPMDLFRLEPGDGDDDFRAAERALDPELRYHVFYDGGRYDPSELGIPTTEMGDIPLSIDTEPPAWADPAQVNGTYLGITQPLFGFGDELFITDQDRSVMDLIGYDIVDGPFAGDWRGIVLDRASNDTNAAVATELEAPDALAGENAVPDRAEFLGVLAPSELTSDENRRTAVEVHGFISNPSDVDVYSFNAVPGSEVWFDIDYTSQSLDTVVELIDANGLVLARSNNSYAESTGLESRFAISGLSTFDLQKSPFTPIDHYSVNAKDAGMRVILPGIGSPNQTATYHVRVRSVGPNLNVLSGGRTEGAYQLQIRLQEADVVEGSSVQYASIRYAKDGVRVRGLPANSPLAGEGAEDESVSGVNPPQLFLRSVSADLALNPMPGIGFPNPQNIGNPAISNNGVVSVSGALNTSGDIDFYLFSLDAGIEQFSGTFEPTEELELVFDVDYADGLGRPDLSLYVYEANIDSFFDVTLGSLVATVEDGNNLDDLPAPFDGTSLQDLSRGSVGTLDPFLGPVSLATGRSYAVVLAPASVTLSAVEEQLDELLPSNPYLRAEPIRTVERLVTATFDDFLFGPAPILDVFIDETSFVPFNLSDVTLFVTQPGAGPTNLFTVDPFQGGAETYVGALEFFQNGGVGGGGVGGGGVGGGGVGGGGVGGGGVGGVGNNGPQDLIIGDIAFAELQVPRNFEDDIIGPPVEYLFAYTQGPDQATAGNYIAISPADATAIGTETGDANPQLGGGVGGGGVGGGNVGNVGDVGDDLIETNQPDPNFTPADPAADPPEVAPLVAVDAPVTYEAIALFQNSRQDYTGYAIGHVELPDFGTIDNVLYTFDHRTGEALSDPGQDFADPADILTHDPPTTLSAMTIKVERGVLLSDLDLSQLPGDDTALIVTGATDEDGSPLIRDGRQLELSDMDGNVLHTLEFNISTDVIVQADPAAGAFVKDGDVISVGTVDYEIETGAVVVFDEDVTKLADGDRIVINDLRRGAANITVEFDSNGILSSPGSLGFTIDPAASAADYAARLAFLINGNADHTAVATAVGNRLSLQFNGAVTATSATAGVLVEGAAGGSVADSVLLPMEEFYTSDQIVAAMTKAMNGEHRVISAGTRISFTNADSADFESLEDRGVFDSITTGPAVTSETVGIRFTPASTDEDIADAIVDAVRNANAALGPKSFGSVVTIIPGETVFDSPGAGFRLAGEAPGGKMNGMTFVGDRLFSVSDRGGLYEITNYAAPQGAVANYLESSAELLRTPFSGLTTAPVGLEDGRYEDMFFAIDARGAVHAFDLDGVRQDVFFNGTSTIQTGLSGSNGLAFSSLDSNLWHVTDKRDLDIGHGPEPFVIEEDIPDELAAGIIGASQQCEGTLTTAACFGGNSIQFGDPNEDLDDNRNFNYPGGAQGTIVSEPFDLRGITAADAPTLYFTYFMTAEEVEAQFDLATGEFLSPKRDAFRVYISDDSGVNGQKGQWHLAATSDALPDPLNPQVTDLNFDLDPDDGIDLDVQQLFNNSFQDTPQFDRPANDLDNIPDVNNGPNGVRDPFPFDDTTSPFPENSGVAQAVAPGDQDDWFDFPEIDETQGRWRQAKIDLSEFVGSSSVRLRFEFSTAAAFDLGGLGGVELKAIPGNELRDGDTFVVDGQAFEFDLGITAVLPAGTSIVDGEKLLLTNSANEAFDLEFDTDGIFNHVIGARSGDELRDGMVFDVSDGTTSVRFEIDSDGVVRTGNVAMTFTSGDSILAVATSLANAIDTSALDISAVANGPFVTLAETNAVFAVGNTPFLTDANRVAVAVSSTSTANQVAVAVVQAVNSSSAGITAYADGHRVNLKEANFAVTANDSEIGIEGSPGTDGIAIDVDSSMTALEVSQAMLGPMSSVLTNGHTDVIKTHQHIVRIFGFTVDDQGPLGLADKLIADEWGAFSNLADITDPAYRGLDNELRLYDFGNDGILTVATPQQDFEVPFEGVYVDDIVIGYASRGEILVDHRIPYNFDDPDNPPFNAAGRIPNIFAQSLATFEPVEDAPTVDVGPYLLEIRLAKTDGVPDNPVDRTIPSTTLFAPAGGELFDGKTFTLNDGIRQFTFEYEDVRVGNGVARGNTLISFSVQDQPFIIAGRIRDAINGLARSGISDLSATMANGSETGISTTSDRVHVFGNAIVVPQEAPNGIEFAVTDATGSGNSKREQGQVIITQSVITNSLGFGIVVEDSLRDLPSYNFFDPFGRVANAQFTSGEYTTYPGPARNLLEINTENVAPGVVISSNVIANNSEGGIRFAGDPGGYIFVAPYGDERGEQGEAFDGYIFEIADNTGQIFRFEFNDLQVDNPSVVGVGNIPVDFDRDAACPWGAGECQSRYNPLGWDMAERLLVAIESSPINVIAYRGKPHELYLEGAVFVSSPNWPNITDFFAVGPLGAAPFGRIVNNTIVGRGGEFTDNRVEIVNSIDPFATEDVVNIIDDFRDFGIIVDDRAVPTVLNNLIVNFETGVFVGASSQASVLGANVYQANFRNTLNFNVGDGVIRLDNDAPLFVDFETGNYYLAAQSLAIDSAVDSLEDRPSLVQVKDAVGIGRSPIIAPDRDALGQLREDDPAVEPPDGQGRNAFKDRGAIDRVDFVGPEVGLLSPRDNDSARVDQDPARTVVSLDPSVRLSSFVIEFRDSSQLGGQQDGTGIDPNTITSESVLITADGTPLSPDGDFTIDFDPTNDVLQLLPSSGRWATGRSYVITLREDLITDIAGNPLRDNQAAGGTQFTINTLLGTDYGDAPAIYPTTTLAGGPSHILIRNFYLGLGATPETDGQPSPAANLDGNDDGVGLPAVLGRGETVNITVTASAAGRLDGWFDFDGDGSFAGPGEQIFASRPLTAGANTLQLRVPDQAVSGDTVARFRFSTLGGLPPTGPALDGEVEDYLVTIDPGNIWQNQTNSLDVTADGFVTPIDVLRVILETNLRRASDPLNAELTIPAVEPNTPESLGFVDVNGDGFVTAIDALTVIRFLNQRATAEPSTDAIAAALDTRTITVDPIGEIMENPLVALPEHGKAIAKSIPDVVVDDVDDDLVSALAGARDDESNETDLALADLDWLNGEV